MSGLYFKKRNSLLIFRNYLRARGEYGRGFRGHRISRELPPRTRRIRANNRRTLGYRGTTSAHAENTRKTLISSDATRNYLRARGEYIQTFRHRGSDKELPPRTRRIPGIFVDWADCSGTTSAHAENTVSLVPLARESCPALCHVFAVENMFFGVPL